MLGRPKKNERKGAEEQEEAKEQENPPLYLHIVHFYITTKRSTRDFYVPFHFSPTKLRLIVGLSWGQSMRTWDENPYILGIT